MGATVIAERFAVGGSSDPAMSALQTFGGIHTYYAIAPFAGGPRDVTNPAAWQCISYKKNTTGTTAPTHTSVIFRRCKQVGDTNPTVGSFVLDISHVDVGEVMYVIADGDGNVANPWGVAIAFFVVRNTGAGPVGGNPPCWVAQSGFRTNIITNMGQNVWDGGPEICAYDDLNNQGSGSGSGSAYGPGTPGIDPDPNLHSPLLDWSAFCFTAGAGVPFTQAWWPPDGSSSTNLAWPNDGKTWGFPVQTSAGSEINARMFTYNVQAPGAFGNDTPPPPQPIASHSVTDIFFMQMMVEGYTPLDQAGQHINSFTSYGTRDVLAEKVRPDFIDQTIEAGGGIFLYS